MAGSSRAASAWRRPSRRRVLLLRDRLREMYGRPRNEPHGEGVEELVRTVLSQHTNDRNRDVAYARLRERFPAWEAVREAPLPEIEEAIRPGGLAKGKARSIKAILERLGDDFDLSWLRDAPRAEALEFLQSLPGVGRKTAACVLLFSYDRPEMPVDTHVHRVGQRLGLIRPQAPFPEAHDEMIRVTPPEDVYDLHMNLIAHGRQICRPKPRCPDCALRRLCPYWREQVKPT